MKFLVVITPPSIYHGCSTQKTFWEEKFTGKKDLFQSVNMKDCGRRKVRKHKGIKGSENIITLNISGKFDSLNKMWIELRTRLNQFEMFKEYENCLSR